MKEALNSNTINLYGDSRVNTDNVPLNNSESFKSYKVHVPEVKHFFHVGHTVNVVDFNQLFYKCC